SARAETNASEPTNFMVRDLRAEEVQPACRRGAARKKRISRAPPRRTDHMGVFARTPGRYPARMREFARAAPALQRHGILLVYPLKNRPEPRSLWHVLHPKVDMVWSWTADADPRVAEMWHLRERLAESRKVPYAKWYSGRATFFSPAVFRAMLGTFRAAGA